MGSRNHSVRAYILIHARTGRSKAIAQELNNLPGIGTAHPCWGVPERHRICRGRHASRTGRPGDGKNPANRRSRAHGHAYCGVGKGLRAARPRPHLGPERA